MNSVAMNEPLDLEGELAALLTELSAAQQELLATLEEKRSCMASGNLAGLLDLQTREAALAARLESCHQARLELLAKSRAEGKPHRNIGQLTATLPLSSRRRIRQEVQSANARSRLLQHQSLAGWVLAQRTMLHLSRLLEIIATGGQQQPTYGTDESVQARGSLLDHTV